MRHNRHIIFLLLAIAPFAACHTDRSSNMIEVNIEQYNTPKVVVDGLDATWDDDEMVRINSETGPIVRRDGRTYIDNVQNNSTNRGLYPSSLTTAPLTSDNIEVSLPRVYHYRTNGAGHQLLELPMAARSTEPSLYFQHLTAAIYFTITNNHTRTLKLDSLTVTSNQYSLSGSRTVDFSNITGTTASLAQTSDDKSVILVFDCDPIVLAPSESIRVMIPVPPVLDDNIFSVRLSSHYNGWRFSVSKSQQTGGALGRNQVAYSSIAISDGNAHRSDLFAGNGTEGNPYLISSAYEFSLMVEALNNSYTSDLSLLYNNRCFALTNDIDYDTKQLTPISAYSGSLFDGRGYTVRNFTITSAGETVGLFTNPKTTLRNLSIDNATITITSNGSSVGAIAGNINGATIQNCHVSNTSFNYQYSVTSTSSCGGIAGKITNNTSTIDNCSSSAISITASQLSTLYYGGIVGDITGTNTSAKMVINQCTVSSPLPVSNEGNMIVGGLIGRCSLNPIITLSNCSFSGNLDITSGSHYTRLGGLLGLLLSGSNESNITISDNSVSGTISATANETSSANAVGAFIGHCTPTPPSFTRCDRSGVSSVTLNGINNIKDIGNK